MESDGPEPGKGNICDSIGLSHARGRCPQMDAINLISGILPVYSSPPSVYITPATIFSLIPSNRSKRLGLGKMPGPEARGFPWEIAFCATRPAFLSRQELLECQREFNLQINKELSDINEFGCQLIGFFVWLLIYLGLMPPPRGNNLLIWLFAGM